MWRLWRSRNQLVFQHQNLSWQSTLKRAKDDVQEWENAQEYIQSLNHYTVREGCNNRESTQQKWEQPPMGWIKCNYDGSFNYRTQQTNSGWLIRDDKGFYKGAAQAVGGTMNNALESELQALVMAMQHTWSQGYRKVIFEGDSKQVEELLNRKQMHFGAFNWIREAWSWRKRFEEVIFSWTPRTNNQPADVLAKSHLPQDTSFIYHYFVPNFITNALHCNHY
ncbi:unnamed protein product [Arabidopsis thaliana]|uniref:RNase H type-1 domain-containing protein n=2 Tax=Arabidopsis thaliana TaxID=3702 RepID=A0A654FI06_ARATH|nr:unnamed protein product [Arabidopsis thaliana]